MRLDGTFHGEHSACARAGRRAFADLVDHIEPVADGGAFWNEQNHQSLCRSCHGVKSDGERSRPRRLVIAGPPGSGKSAFVEAQRRPGDLVWDLDAIAATIAMCPTYPRPSHVVAVLAEIREAFMRRLAANPLLSCYVIVTDPSDAAILAARLGARVHACSSSLVR